MEASNMNGVSAIQSRIQYLEQICGSRDEDVKSIMSQLSTLERDIEQLFTTHDSLIGLVNCLNGMNSG
jgi:hypothetical protein